jgi:ABC-type dipeptide/oligopeptide/nickel transport system permease subunit
VAIGTTTGVTIGIATAYFSGKLDILFQRLMNALMGFPGLVLVLALVVATSFLGSAIIIEASLSFLGLGMPPLTPLGAACASLPSGDTWRPLPGWPSSPGWH